MTTYFKVRIESGKRTKLEVGVQCMAVNVKNLKLKNGQEISSEDISKYLSKTLTLFLKGISEKSTNKSID